nr:hypothetical protein [Tanacetum cinerariifolium]
MELNLTQPSWDASEFLFKEDYTIVHKTRAVIHIDRNNQKKMMRETEVHKFSDGTLTRMLEKLEHMIKDFSLFKFNLGMENRTWSEDDKRRSKEFIEVIERRFKIRRIFGNLESFFSGSQNQRDLLRDNPLVSVEVLRYDIKRSKSENKGIVPTEMELVLEQNHQDALVLRIASAAAKPCQGDSLEFYLITGDKERRNSLSISKLKAAYYPDFRLKERIPSLWIECKREYDISAANGISHWWFKCNEFYIKRYSTPFDRHAVRSHMRILSVVSLKTFSRYAYTYLKEIVLCRADYKEYKISEADFEDLHSNDFKDLYLLHLQGNLNHLFGADKLRIESYQTKLNLTQPSWDASDFLFKEDYTIVHKPRAVIYRDRNNHKKMMRESKVHKFSDGTLTRILEKLNH